MIGIYIKNKAQFDELASIGSIETLSELLKFLSIIGLYDEKYYGKVEAKILEVWISNKSLPKEVETNLINGFLSIWANLRHHNEFIYNSLIKPFI